MADKIQLRRDLSNVWELVNPTLSDGEVGIEKDTHKMKIGNGVDAWNDLHYLSTENITSVNGEIGEVVLKAEDVDAIPSSEKGVADGVAKLNADGKVIDANGNEVEGKVKSVNSVEPDENGNIEVSASDLDMYTKSEIDNKFYELSVGNVKPTSNNVIWLDTSN